MNNWKFHLTCLIKGLGVYVVIGLGMWGFFHLLRNHSLACFVILMTPVVLLGAYAWGRGMEGK